MNCPCQSGKKYAECCERFISQHELPENAEQLMRSRYSAYVLNQRDYLWETWQSDYRPQDLTLDQEIQWIGLSIIDAPAIDGDQAQVEFEAKLLVAGKVDAMHEKSYFVFDQGRWLYTTGEMLLPSFAAWKPGRNEACPCGSGMKFKRCCGA